MKINPAFLSDPATLRLFQALPNGTENLRFVGGCVRDAILGLEISDLDMATTLHPEDLIQYLSKDGIKVIPTGIDHGTITVIINRATFQITTLRSDISTNGRHAKVSFTDDWRTDALRRDFTINALSLNSTGTVYDYTHGLKDLTDNHLQFIGDPQIRITEDYLRILRYFRFLNRFGQKKVDQHVLIIIARNAPHLTRLSGERVSMELEGILNHPDPDNSLELMIKTNVLNTIIHMNELPSLWFNLRNHEKNFKTQHHDIWLRRLYALLNGDIKLIKMLKESLKLSNKSSQYLILISKLLAQDKIKPFAGIYCYGLSSYQDYLLLSSFSDSDIEKLWQEAEALAMKPIMFPIQGEDLIELGVIPGAEMGQFLASIKQWWLDQDGQPSKTDCLDYFNQNHNNNST